MASETIKANVPNHQSIDHTIYSDEKGEKHA